MLNATKLADDPELTDKANLIPINSASFFSNCSLKRPVVNQPSNDASTIFSNSAEPITLPDGGIIVSPGTNSFGEYTSFAYSLTSVFIRLRSCTAFSVIINSKFLIVFHRSYIIVNFFKAIIFILAAK